LDRFITKVAVEQMVGLKYPAIWERIRKGTFPRGVLVGDGPSAPVRWRESEILEWMDARPLQSTLGDADWAASPRAQAMRERGRKGGLARAAKRKTVPPVRRRLIQP
jgi:predicted DNA-binding transcriptional regulator AlpA